MAVVLSPEAEERLRRYYGLDRPLPVQFVVYLKGLLRGDLGFSIAFHEPVSGLIARRLPWTLFLVGFSTLLAAGLGVLLGSLSAWRWGSRVDRSLLVTLLALGSLPEFLVGMGLLLIFGLYLGLFPLLGAETPFRNYPPGWLGLVARAGDIAWHATLPGLTLTLAHLPNFYFLMRNSMLNVIGEPYILTARAKGLCQRTIIFRHALKNAFLPVAALFGVRIGFIVVGAIVVETLFAYPGMGSLMVEAIQTRDYPLMQGVFLVISLFVLGANFLTDTLYSRLDPRVKLGKASA